MTIKALVEVQQMNARNQTGCQPEGNGEVDVLHELNNEPLKVIEPVRLFVSYAHEDERLLKRLDPMLAILEQHYGLQSWRDRRLISGVEWEKEIRRHLENMDIFLFIASPISLVRPYIRNIELRRARERWEQGEVQIVTVKLEPCACDEDEVLGKLQRLGSRFPSIAQAKLKSAAWEQVRLDLLPVISDIQKRKGCNEHV